MSFEYVPLGKAVILNPRLKIKKESLADFVEMADLRPGERWVRSSTSKEVGGGSRFQTGDTLFARITPCLENGKIAQYRSEADDVAFGSTEFIVMRGREGVSINDYVTFLARSGEFRAKAESLMSGTSGRQRVSLEALANHEVVLPPLQVQEQVADLLNPLDEKIELNHQTARTLEELAERLFKSWFVDFDPVRAKMAGRQPVHMPSETAALFPEKLVDSPLGPIPEGWEFQSLDDLAEFVNGKNFTKNATGGGRMVMRIAELNSGPGGRTVWNDVETDEKHIANPGDIVFAWSGSLGVYRWYRNPALINQHIFKVIPKTGVSEAFSYQAVLGLIEEFRQIAAAKAVTMGHIKRSDLKDNGLYLPSSQDLIGAYSEIASPMWDRALMLEQESETLAALRDRLLPKLISGEIRVPEAQESAEEA